MQRINGWVMALGLLMAGARHSTAGAVVVINEVLADPPAAGGDANGDGVVSATKDEFIELSNLEFGAVGLAGWSLSDAVGVRHIFSEGASIPGRGFFVVFGGGSPQGFAHAATASSGGLSLNNATETVTLKDAAASLIDVLTYGAEGGKDTSLTRSPDGTGAWVLHSTVSPLNFSAGTTSDGSELLSGPPDPVVAPEAEDPETPEPADEAVAEPPDVPALPLNGDGGPADFEPSFSADLDDLVTLAGPAGSVGLPITVAGPQGLTLAEAAPSSPPAGPSLPPSEDGNPVVPEPSSLILLAAGIAASPLARRRLAGSR